LARQTTYWVFDTRTGEFAPNKWCGYVDMTPRKYADALAIKYTGDRFDGEIAREAIEKALRQQRYKSNAPLHPKLEAWARAVWGAKAFKRINKGKWRFLVVRSAAANRGRFGKTNTPKDVDTQPTADSAELDRRVRRLLSSGRVSQPPGHRNPKTVTSSIQTFVRDPWVKAWVLQEANGYCECCGEEAPFRTSDRIPYLEVHHVRLLANGGSDTVGNAVAVCPNCHRNLHLGADAQNLREELFKSIKRLRKE